MSKKSDQGEAVDSAPDPLEDSRAAEMALIGKVDPGDYEDPEGGSDEEGAKPRSRPDTSGDTIPKSRLDKVIGQRNDTERENEELKRRVAQLEQSEQVLSGITTDQGAVHALEQYYAYKRGQPGPIDTGRNVPHAQFDPEDPDHLMMAQVAQGLRSEMQQQLQAMSRHFTGVLQPVMKMTADTLKSQLKEAYPDYDSRRDDPQIERVIQRAPGLSMLEAYTIVRSQQGKSVGRAMESDEDSSEEDAAAGSVARPRGVSKTGASGQLAQLHAKAERSGRDEDWEAFIAAQDKATGAAERFFLGRG